MPRSIDGHGSVRTRYPPPPLGTTLASSSTTSATMPGSGVCADPGLVSVTPGRGLIMMPPVSVCHHVSTTGVRSPPMTWRYQIHASGLIGSPPPPSTPRGERAEPAGGASPPLLLFPGPPGGGERDGPPQLFAPA